MRSLKKNNGAVHRQNAVSAKPRLVAWAILFLFAVALILVLVQKPPTEWEKAEAFGVQIQSMGALGFVLFLTAGALATSIGLPRQFFAFVGGYVFGLTEGVLLSSIAAIVGCAITFSLSRYLFANKVAKRYGAFVSALNTIIREDTFLKIIVLRLQPLGTNLLTNLCAGVSDIPARTFLVSSWVGYLPQMLVFALMGSGVRIGSNEYLLYGLSLLLISLLLGGFLYKRYIQRMNKLGHEDSEMAHVKVDD